MSWLFFSKQLILISAGTLRDSGAGVKRWLEIRKGEEQGGWLIEPTTLNQEQINKSPSFYFLMRLQVFFKRAAAVAKQ